MGVPRAGYDAGSERRAREVRSSSGNARDPARVSLCGAHRSLSPVSETVVECELDMEGEIRRRQHLYRAGRQPRESGTRSP